MAQGAQLAVVVKRLDDVIKEMRALNQQMAWLCQVVAAQTRQPQA